jgi:hypothetical protein
MVRRVRGLQGVTSRVLTGIDGKRSINWDARSHTKYWLEMEM